MSGIAQNLLAGSRNLNKMREEIKEVIGILVSTLERTRSSRQTEQMFIDLEGPDGWGVRRSYTNTRHGDSELGYAITRYDPDVHGGDGVLVYSSVRHNELPASMVEELHDSLDSLVEWIEQDFDGVREELDVLFQVS